MLLSITSTSPDATDLGYLLHKHPDRVRSVDIGFGTAHVFYPQADADSCTVILLVEVDPIRLSRRRKDVSDHGLEPYVNDRPYAASSMLSVAIGRLYGSAMSGSCETRPELVEAPIDLEVSLPVVAAHGGEELVAKLFTPLGYEVTCEALALDEQFPAWGASAYLSVMLKARLPVQRMLEHLYVLLPVLDNRKHYWVAEDEIDKLFRRGGEWLPVHPEAEFITRRYLRFRELTRPALAQLSVEQDSDDIDGKGDDLEALVERPLSLNEQRLATVTAAVVEAGGGRVVDLGCGEGSLISRLMAEPSVTEVLGVDVSISVLDRAEKRLKLDELSERRREKVRLVQGALTYIDGRTAGFDVATVIEVIEHLDLERLDVFARVLFSHSAPTTVIVTTPNVEYNVHFERLGDNEMRHRDHRFEWSRAEFQQWAHTACEHYGYSAEFRDVGEADAATGPPTQMAIFRRAGAVTND